MYESIKNLDFVLLEKNENTINKIIFKGHYEPSLGGLPELVYPVVSYNYIETEQEKVLETLIFKSTSLPVINNQLGYYRYERFKNSINASTYLYVAFCGQVLMRITK
jgi:hypothetical protein